MFTKCLQDWYLHSAVVSLYSKLGICSA